MEWIERPDGLFGATRWIPKSQAGRLDRLKGAGKKATDARKAFKDAKRRRVKPDKLKPLKVAAEKALADRDKIRQEVVDKGVYVVRDPRGYVVMRHSGSETHGGPFPDLKEAQEAARKL